MVRAVKFQRALAPLLVVSLGACAGPSLPWQHRDPGLEPIHSAYDTLMANYVDPPNPVALLGSASRAYGYGLDLEAIARIWRGGCIIRAALLERVRAAYRARPALPNLLVDPDLAEEIMARAADLRAVVCRAAEAAIPVPAFSATLAYLDGYRSAWLPANLIQAQRDYFGAHTYERVDTRGVFHTEWSREQ